MSELKKYYKKLQREQKEQTREEEYKNAQKANAEIRKEKLAARYQRYLAKARASINPAEVPKDDSSFYCHLKSKRQSNNFPTTVYSDTVFPVSGPAKMCFYMYDVVEQYDALLFIMLILFVAVYGFLRNRLGNTTAAFVCILAFFAIIALLYLVNALLERRSMKICAECDVLIEIIENSEPAFLYDYDDDEDEYAYFDDDDDDEDGDEDRDPDVTMAKLDMDTP